MYIKRKFSRNIDQDETYSLWFDESKLWFCGLSTSETLTTYMKYQCLKFKLMLVKTSVWTIYMYIIPLVYRGLHSHPILLTLIKSHISEFLNVASSFNVSFSNISYIQNTKTIWINSQSKTNIINVHVTLFLSYLEHTISPTNMGV